MINPSVLLVDDEAPFVTTMAKRLNKRDVNVQVAYSGEQALEIISNGGPSKIDIVILDVKMPGMDGLETLGAIKAQYPTMEVIMLTGHATVENAIEGMKRGAFDYLMKPCDMEVLIAKVEEACRKKRQHEAKILEARAQMIALRRGD